MLEIKNLLNRRTVKNFLDKKIDAEILDNAIRVAWKAPTSLNSKPVILLNITQHKTEDWISAQPAVATAPHLFLFAVSPDQGEANARAFLAGRYGSEIGDAKVSAAMERIVKNKEAWAIQQVYLTAAYFAATLEASAVSGCFIAGFSKDECRQNVALPEGYQAELIFACGYANPENDGSHETESMKSFDDFYFPEL